MQDLIAFLQGDGLYFLSCHSRSASRNEGRAIKAVDKVIAQYGTAALKGFGSRSGFHRKSSLGEAHQDRVLQGEFGPAAPAVGQVVSEVGFLIRSNEGEMPKHGPGFWLGIGSRSIVVCFDAVGGIPCIGELRMLKGDGPFDGPLVA